jgi:hypothetical protein
LVAHHGGRDCAKRDSAVSLFVATLTFPIVETGNRKNDSRAPSRLWVSRQGESAAARSGTELLKGLEHLTDSHGLRNAKTNTHGTV